MREGEEGLDAAGSEYSEWHQGGEGRNVVLDEHLPGGERPILNALVNGKANGKKGCFWKYMYGECANKDCTMDHRKEVIQGM